MSEPPVIRGHQGSSGFIRVHQAIRRTSRPSAVRIPTARPDDASNSTRDTCVLSFNWQPACFVSPRTRALTMAAVPVGRVRRRGEQRHADARFAHDDAIEAHLRVESQVERLDGRSHSACKPSRLWVRPPPSPPTAGSGSNGAIKSSQVKAGQGKASQGRKRSGRDGAIKGHQWSSGVIRGHQSALRVHSVVIRGDQTCSRKQIMSSQLRMKGSVTRSSSRIFSNGPLSFSGPPALRSTLNSAGM